jgi:uncharacterized SAM-binding protein YcdF (DUF218 family)
MHLTHFVKQLAGTAATPLACAFLITLGGAIVRLFGRRRLATALWSAAAILVYLSAIAPVADALLAPLEARYPPLGDIQNLPPLQYIVVLGSDYGPRDGIPVTGALSSDGLARIAEGIRLMRKVPGARLVVSGGGSEGETPSAIGYVIFATDLGVDAGEIIKLDKSLDTAEEAGSVAALVGQAPFILVTSAYHMPRAMRLMQIAGAHPIPAPTGQLVPRRQFFYRAQAWIPSVGSLRKTERALHEYIGLAIVN